MKKNKEVFKVYVDDNGVYHREQDKDSTRKEVELAVEKPGHKVKVEGDAVFGKAVKDFVQKGVMLSVEVDDVMKARNLWDEVKEKKSKELNKKIANNVLKIRKGGCKFSEAVKFAKEVIKDRNELLILNLQRNELSKHTAESLAENLRFDYLVSQCTVYNNTGEQFFESYEKYLEKPFTEEVVVEMASNALFLLVTGLGEDFRKDLPEYQFLLKHNLCDEKLRLLDKDKNFIDLDGNKVNEHGQRINENGELLDYDGNVVDDKVEFTPFLDG